MSTRRVVVAAVGAVLVAAGARAEIRVTGAVYTERPTEAVVVRAWAVGPRLVADPAQADRPLAETTARPGDALALDLPDGALPVRVEAVAAGHVAAAFDLVLPGQAALPPIWLPAGAELAVRVEGTGGPAVGARVWGTFGARPELEDDRRGWRPVVPATAVDGRGEAGVRVPPGGSVELVGRDAQGRWGRRQERLGTTRKATVRLTSQPATVLVRDGRGEPVAGIAVAASTAPAGTAAVTGAGGQATVQAPVEGEWALVTLGAAGSARALRRGAAKGKAVLTVGAAAELEVAWTGTAGPVVLAPSWLPEALGGDVAVVATGERARLPFFAPGGALVAWAPGATTSSVEVGEAARAVALRFAPALRIEGTLADEGGGAVAGAPVWRWAPPAWMRRVRSTGRMPSPLDKPLLPAAVSSAGGGFTLADVPAGTFRLTARKSGLPEADSGPLPGAAGTTQRVALQFVRGTWLAVRTEDAAGRGLSGVKVEVFPAGAPRAGGTQVIRLGGDARPEPLAAGATDLEGRLTLAALPPRGLSVRLALPGYVPRETPATLPAEGLDLGLQVLEPGVQVSGRVLDERGQGAAGAEVRAAAMPGRFPGEPLATSDALGHFVIADQPGSGELLLEASGEKLVSAGPTKVTLPPGGPVEIRVRQARVLEGRVVDERDAEPVSGAVVDASRRTRRVTGGGAMAFSMVRMIGSTECDERGVFKLDSLEPGELSLAVSFPGFKTADLQVVVPEDRPAETVTVVLKRGLAIHGRVEDGRGSPAAGLAVEAAPASAGDRRMEMGRGGSARTDPEGGFVVDGLEAGRFELTAADETGALATAVVEAGRDEEVVLRLEAPGRLAARVVDEAGGPIAGADVSAFGSAGAAVADQVTTAADGLATFESLPPQRYRVSASAEGLARDLQEATVTSGQTAEVTLTLERGGTINGRIVGLPAVELARCMVRGGGTGDSPKPDGSFVLQGVRPGPLEVSAAVFPDGRQRSVRTEVTDIEVPVSVEIDFTTGITVRGTVRRASRPAAGVTVSAGGRGERVSGSAMSDADGAYEIGGLDPGELVVRAIDEVGRTLAAQTVQARGDTRVDLVVPAGTLAGRVLDARRREGIAGARVQATSVEPPRVDRSAQTGEDGAFRLAELADGGWALRVEASGYAPGDASARLSLGRASDVEVALEPEQRLDLVLREADGTIPGAAMVLPLRDGRVEDPIWVRCDREGRASVTTLLPGAYTLLVIASGAALHRVTVPTGEVPVQLQPAGRLVVMPPVESSGAGWRVRVAAGGGVAVPVSPWANPARTEWVAPGGNPLTLRVPAGAYVVEAITPAGTTRQIEAGVPPDGDITVALD